MAKKKGSNLKFLRDPKLGPYQVQLDEHCFIAQKNTTSAESGNVYTNVIGHYNSLSNALKAIATDELKSTNYDSLSSFLETYEKITNRLENLVNV